MSIHKPVLLNETIKLLNLKDNLVVVDATLGGGGHSEAILNRIGDNGKLIAIDADEEAIERFKLKIQSAKFKVKENLFLINDNFSNLERILEAIGINKVDGIIADLGWSSDQVLGRGMSFQKDEELDMRFNKSQKLTAREIINEYPKDRLEKIIREYGEEKFSGNIAKKIINYREDKNIKTTGELAEIIKESIPGRFWGKINPATKTFQALRIEVNDELDNLRKFLPKAISALNPKGRLAVISFHSLEDRIVKNIFRENAGGCICPPASQLQILQKNYLSEIEKKGFSAIDLDKALRAGPKEFPQCRCGRQPEIEIITKKPIIAGEKEIEGNPRARSAKLRVCEKY